MTSTGRVSLLVLAAVFVLSAGLVAAGENAKTTTYTLSALTKNIDQLQKKEVVLEGTIVGICKSGCKMWIAEGDYEKGDAFALVRAKDDAFKFDKDATGKKVILYGYVTAKYLDYCSETGEEQEGAMDKCAVPVEAQKAETKKDDKDKKDKVVDVTFFATKVKYL